MAGTARAAHLRIEGRVQGVGYRAWMADEADARGVAGWVRNRRDGSVEAVVEGPPEAVAALIALCREGPPAAVVTGVTVTERSGEGHDGFELRPTA